MQIIQIADVYSQTFNVAVAGQACTVNLYQKSTGFYCDVLINNAVVIAGVLCENLNKIVRDLYLGVIGDFVFRDTQGTSDPSSPGLGTRFQFLYLETKDLNGQG